MKRKYQAPNFAAKLHQYATEQQKTQRQIAKNLKISLTCVNELFKYGTGSDDHAADLLESFNLKDRHQVELLADRRAELSHGRARKLWSNFRYAFRDELEYMQELCPFPLDRAFACTQHKVSIPKLMSLAKKHGFTNISELKEINPFRFMEFIEAFRAEFAPEAFKAVLSSKCKTFPPILNFEFDEVQNAGDYVRLINCQGRLFFGLPHILVGDYTFEKNGTIRSHRNTGGVEIIYSLEGTFELTCKRVKCPSLLYADKNILAYDARVSHEIQLVDGEKGRLFMARFDPRRRSLKSGRPLRHIQIPRET